MLKIVLPQRPTFFSTWGTKTETFPGWKWHSSSDATIWPPAVFLFSARRKAYNVILKNFPRVGKISTEITLRAYYCDTLKTWSLSMVHVSDFPESQVFTQNLVAGLPWWSMVKSLPFNAGGLPLWLRWWRIHLQCGRPELGRSPGEGKGYPLQYSGWENSMDCIVRGATKVRHDRATFTISNARDAGSIPGWGTKIPHAAGQLNSSATAKTEIAK